MKHLVTTLLSLIFVIAASATLHTIDDIPNVHRADSLRHVVDPDNILSAQTRATLDRTINQIWRDTSAELSVVIVDSVDTDDHDAFATNLFTRWGIGKSDNDNGLLLFVAKGQGKIVIRTGYGLEGAVPDIVAGRIIRNVAIPRFRQGDIDGGVVDAVAAINEVITNPDVRDEIMSSNPNNAFDSGIDTAEVMKWWVNLGLFAAIAMAIAYVFTIIRTRRRDAYERYKALHELLIPAAVVSAIGLGIPLIVLLILYITMRRTRTRRRICSNCGNKMHRLDEKNDNAYLTPAQDTEEQLKSVDYDVWLCDNCGETDILPYVNKASTYRVCSHCKARAASLRADRILVRPTTSREGYGVKSYICKNCHQTTDIPYKISRKEPPVVIIPSGGGGLGGGSFGGGSFGGGATGGGGASGSW